MTKGIVYKIELNDEIYVGSTEEKLCRRQSKHNYEIKKYPNRKLYKSCIEEGIEKIKCIWVADIEFNSTAEKRAIEEEYRKDLNAKLNSRKCYRTVEEKKIDDKKYREKNKDRIAEYKKLYELMNHDRKIQLQRERRKRKKEEMTIMKDKIT